MDAANARIDERLNRRIGVRGRARVVRVVDHARDAGVDAAERGDQVADVDIVRAIVAREPIVRRRHVIGDRAVRDDAAKLPFPRMAMRIDEPGNDDRVRGVDHLRLGRRFACLTRRR